ncbi:hypothetical protein L6164_002717 [Bauhinia variegata]|uniref:Uncharacterized protein n=1 Tax=Bauhinia variegata TaxID=167791 RepID=A0ACB9PZN2_BAUVA|nr:hypothetical protein L6164_002717 [Bauhinia variegata]
MKDQNTSAEIISSRVKGNSVRELFLGKWLGWFSTKEQPKIESQEYDGIGSVREYVLTFLDDMGVHKNNPKLCLREFS